MSSYNKCGACKEKGHNVRTCKKHQPPLVVKRVPPKELTTRTLQRELTTPRRVPNKNTLAVSTQNVSPLPQNTSIIIALRDAMARKQFRKVNQIVVGEFENSKKPEVFLNEVLNDASLQSTVATQLLEYKGYKTPSIILKAITRSAVPFSLKAKAADRLYERGEVVSTFMLPSQEETLQAKKTLEKYINSPWETKGFPCPQPHICKVSYHKPKTAWRNWGTGQTPNQLDIENFNTGLQLNTESLYQFPNFFNKNQISCPFIVEEAKIMHETFLASPEGATGQLDVVSVPLKYSYGDYGDEQDRYKFTDSVSYETIHQNDGPDGYYEWYEVIEVHVGDNEEFPYVLADHFFKTVLPSKNLVGNFDLDVYTLAQSLKLVSGMNKGHNWKGNIEDSGGAYWDPRVGMMPAQHFTPSERKFYIDFLTKTSNERVVDVLNVEYDNVPEYVKTAEFAKEKKSLSELAGMFVGNREGGLIKKVPPAEMRNREQKLSDKITAVIYEKENGEIEFIDGRKRVSEALWRGLEEVEVIVGRRKR